MTPVFCPSHLYCTVCSRLCRTILCCTVLYCTVLYCCVCMYCIGVCLCGLGPGNGFRGEGSAVSQCPVLMVQCGVHLTGAIGCDWLTHPLGDDDAGVTHPLGDDDAGVTHPHHPQPTGTGQASWAAAAAVADQQVVMGLPGQTRISDLLGETRCD